MSGVNKVILVGHLGKDPEVRHLEGGATVVNFTLATTETYTRDGRKVEQTEWHNVVMWRGLAEIAAKYLQKGKLVYVEGKLRTRSYDDRDGNKRYVTEIVADNFNMLGRKSDNENGTNQSTASQNPSKPEDQMIGMNDNTEDDLPF
ncbi:single-strand binding protein [Arcticibacter tournemirensis]|uniref:Single-stranded DNA-binding protein n=1 Tax=Arcticibacter tournemirensis TaxID=699437 RepID=A0A5M9GUV7_9SPHI|nr:single-stranded DNA-binding protein [Arcticibacter tournemirensis]KAA8477555.1 single-stranded DNA-binding protein [Arcticibacter tournemirensis]TQM48357.1 single-strand binding protein [Arcticibacter tournemirensis]